MLLHPCACRPHHRPRRRADPEPHRRPAAWRDLRRRRRWMRSPRGSAMRSGPGSRRASTGRCWRPAADRARGSPGRSSGLRVRTFDQDHGYSRSLGLRIGGFGYSTDVVRLDEAAFAALAGVDTLGGRLASASRRIRRTRIWTGCWPGSARVGPRRTVLTHMGTDMDWASWLRACPRGWSWGSTGWCWKWGRGSASGGRCATGDEGRYRGASGPGEAAGIPVGTGPE